VVVRCGDVDILLAHLRRGSVLVKAGSAVELGQPLGKVGNSGYSMEPHLHLGAQRRGKEVGLVFDNRQLSVNSVLAGVQK
jgi:murein DD-endopeptidase MepM/ murein hydrolase activator NlpD